MSNLNLNNHVGECHRNITQIDKNTGFVVTKSGNSNILNYSFTDDQDIIKPYWLMYEKKNGDEIPREDLTFMEKTMAYGTKIERLRDKFYELKVIGYPSVPMLVDCDKKIVMVKHDGEYQVLLGLYVHESTSIFKGVEGLTIVTINKDKKLSNFYISA